MPTHLTGRFGLVITIALAFNAFKGSGADDFKQPEPLEPQVAEASGEAVEAMAGIRVPDQWQISLYAAEPNIANVVAFDIDHRGRMYVCESFRQKRGVTDNRDHDQQWLLADLAAETVQDRIDYHKRLLGDAAVTYAQHDDRLRRLEDTDGDGAVDRSVVIANGFNRIEEGTGAGVLVRGDAIYYSCIPKLWKLVDQDQDGSVDERVVLSDGYGVRVAFRGHDMHGLVMGNDGRLYFSIGDRGYHVTTDDGRVLANPDSGAVFRCELDGSGLEVFATGMRNPQELAFNDLGDLFTVDNNSDSGDKARVLHLLEGGDFGWRMYFQYLPDRGPFNRDKIWQPLHNEQPAHILPPVANLTDGPSGLAFYPGTGFGDDLKDTFLICDFRGGPAASGIRSFQLEPDGAFYKLTTQCDLIWNVLATDVGFGPDGAIYLSDWVDGWEGLGKGRVYRVIDPDHHSTPLVKQVQQILQGDWSVTTSEQLAEHLSHVDRRVRFEAQWELARRGDKESLLQLAHNPRSGSVSRLHAIWGADQIARLDGQASQPILTSLRELLSDDDATIRAAAAKVAGERLDKESVSQIRQLLADPSPRVRYFAVMSLAKLSDVSSFGVIVKLLAGESTDPAMRHAGVIFLSSTQDPNKIGELAAHSSPAVRRAAVVALRRSRSAELTKFLVDADPLVAGEAARAIYDEPVPVAISALAAMIDDAGGDAEFVRRILNANYRLGTAQAMSKLAAFAGRISERPAMRIEALELLANWNHPDPRDRVLNAYRPLSPRKATGAAETLAPHIDSLMTSEEAVREKAIEVAAALGISKIVPRLVQRVADAQLRPTMRATALSSLARLDRAKAVRLAREVKLTPATKLVPAALEVLAKYDSKQSLGRFIEATNSPSREIRQMAWDILAGNEAPEAVATIVRGVQAYLDAALPYDVHLNVLEAAEGKLGEELKTALSLHGQSLAQGDSLGPWLVALDGGNPDRGRRLFFESTKLSCVRCHKVERAGGEVGPELTIIGKQKDRRYLLESLCLPDAQIANGFETVVIVTVLGKVFTGIVKAENQDYVELVQNDGSQTRIPCGQIERRRKGKSPMPDDLTKLMTLRDLRDLVAYLASLKQDSGAAETL